VLKGTLARREKILANSVKDIQWQESEDEVSDTDSMDTQSEWGGRKVKWGETTESERQSESDTASSYQPPVPEESPLLDAQKKASKSCCSCTLF